MAVKVGENSVLDNKMNGEDSRQRDSGGRGGRGRGNGGRGGRGRRSGGGGGRGGGSRGRGSKQSPQQSRPQASDRERDSDMATHPNLLRRGSRGRGRGRPQTQQQPRRGFFQEENARTATPNNGRSGQPNQLPNLLDMSWPLDPRTSNSLHGVRGDAMRGGGHRFQPRHGWPRAEFPQEIRRGNNRSHSLNRNSFSDVNQSRGLRGIGRQSSARSRHDKKEIEITCSVLSSWAEMDDAGQLVLLMASEQQKLKTFIQQNTAEEDWLLPLLDAVNHAITAQHQKESIRQLLDCLVNSQFFEHLTNYLTDKQLNDADWCNACDFFTSCINILDEVMTKLPQYANIGARMATLFCNAAHDMSSISEDKILNDAIASFSKKAKEVFLAEKNKELRRRGQLTCSSNLEQPPDNFIDIPVIPTESDLHEDSNPFFRRAMIKGGYDDVDHYLDVQFRLLRQDFIIPLRKGIVEFKKSGCKKYFNSSDLRFYYDVHICGTICVDGIDHVLQFDVSRLKDVSWELSKRLMFGSLLCLSKDNFETVLFATVAHHDVKFLAKGIVAVNFKNGLDEVFNSTSSDAYIMAETTTMFESFYHVLEGLQEILTKLPLQHYIIHCGKEICPPGYLLPSGGAVDLPIYDLKCMMRVKAKKNVAVLTTVRWPYADEMCLNESQRAAAQLALTKELAIIQGPPGTGKTYVGLKVMQVLLENTDVICGNVEKCFNPILVVCYTNHALDQFLEGVLEFCPEGIVRVGGQCKSEKLQKLNLVNLKKKASSGSYISTTVENCRSKCREISKQINDINEKLEFMQTDIISENDLKKYIKSTHNDSLLLNEAAKSRESNWVIYDWLQTSRDKAKNRLPRMIKQHLTMLVLNMKTNSKHIHLTDQMNIIERASFYHAYLQKYVNQLQTLKLELKKEDDLRREQIDTQLKAAQTRILADSELGKVLFPGALKKIKSYLIKEDEIRRSKLDDYLCLQNVKRYPNNVVACWLLRLENCLQSQLDDIEILTNPNKRGKGNSLTFYRDHSFRQIQNNRMVDVDNSYADKVSASIKETLNNLASVKQRADTLGVKDDGLMDEWNKKKQCKINLLGSKGVEQKRLIEPMTVNREQSVTDVWDLELDERFALYNLWVKRYKLTLTEKMQKLVEEYKCAHQRKKEASSEETLFVLSRSKVIGMTTSGAAKHRAVLQTVGCRIIVVEEAAEVLEAHIVTSLNKNCQHLILIGDHQQLKPSPNVYELATKYGLDISLFERLVKNNVPHVMLKEQHRMRPEISKMMLHIYPDIKDHSSVEKYKNIRGVSKNMFFIQHEHEEVHMEESKSKANAHEASYLVALCQYLINQDYKESQITILATYSGQVFEIKKAMTAQVFTHDVVVTTVDNFQGEENDIILLSLVRSNTENVVGFLKVDNRVCVALSRAKMGLYVIGNFSPMVSHSTLWSKIIETATLDNAIGLELPVLCQTHPSLKQLIVSEKDFQKCPEGGCGQSCTFKLQCGHACRLLCHGYDVDHTKYECQKPCARKCEMGHPCELNCYEDCCCWVLVTKHILFCGHDDQVSCYLPEDQAVCSQRCSKTLNCGHQCPERCGKCKRCEVHGKCMVLVSHLWPCGHTNEVPCSMDKSVPCPKLCGEKLECGHACIGKCNECLNEAIHVACGAKCDKLLPCGHQCNSFCGVPCRPCERSCPNRCRHTSCFTTDSPKLCGHACQPCYKECNYKCNHTKCSKFCYEDWKIQPCMKKCTRRVASCKHKCSSLCSELCVCKKCSKICQLPDKLKTSKIEPARRSSKTPEPAKSRSKTPEASTVGCKGKETKSCPELSNKLPDTDMKGEKTTNSVGNQEKGKEEVQRLIIKIPSCDHIFYVDELDKYISDFDPNGCGYILCPICCTPILNCARYENINKERSRKRELEKSRIIQNGFISVEQRKRNLLESQQRLKRTSLLNAFHLLRMTEVKNEEELLAMSFQLKCAFMLNAISSVMENNLDSNCTELLESRKTAILNLLKDRLTFQQKTEFTTELSRCFWLFYLTHVKSCSFPGALVNLMKCNLEDEVKDIIKALGKLNPSNDTLIRAENVSSKLISKILEISDKYHITCQRASKVDTFVIWCRDSK